MRRAILTRVSKSDEGVFGELVTDTGYYCATGELPWQDNATGKSCIPSGVYRCTWRASPKHGMCYHVEDVPGRTDIQIHAANWMGDVARGKRCQLLGCIAPGKAVGLLEGQKAVLGSRDALKALEKDLEHAEFKLTIKERA